MFARYGSPNEVAWLVAMPPFPVEQEFAIAVADPGAKNSSSCSPGAPFLARFLDPPLIDIGKQTLFEGTEINFLSTSYIFL